MIVLDTHVLAWADSDERKLGRRAKALINRLWVTGRVAVCAMTFWEIALLQSRGRIRLRNHPSSWRILSYCSTAMIRPVAGRTRYSGRPIRRCSTIGLKGIPLAMTWLGMPS